MFDFIVDTFLKISKKEGIKSTFTNEIIISYNNKNDIEKLWLYYLAFCIKNKQIYKSKNVLKNNIQSRYIMKVLKNMKITKFKLM